MHRTFRWRYYTKRQREILLGLACGSTAAIGVGISRSYRPLLADSGSATETKSWSAKFNPFSNPSVESGKQRLKAPDQKGDHTPPPQTKGHSTFESEGDADSPVSAWENATHRVSEARDSFTGWDFASLRTKITEKILPSWIKIMPGYIDKLQNELSGAPYSLSWEIWEDAHDPEVNPEVIWDARVRMSSDLCPEEQAFLSFRRNRTAKALAKYLDIPEADIHPDDVPVIGLCGSGGGLRALVAGASSALCTQQSGLFDCVTYTAGVSGSCWLQTLFNSSIGQGSYQRIIDHLKQRIQVHIAYPPAALKLLSTMPTNKFLLSGYVEKLRGVPDADFGLVDV
jgi:cytosolic phospholipase A2